MFFLKKKPAFLPIIIALVAILLVFLSATLAAVFWGDRTGLGNGGTSVGSGAPPPTGSEPPPVGTGSCLAVPAIKQNGASWCGRGAGQMVVAFFKPSIGTNSNWQNTHFAGGSGFSTSALNSYLSGTGASYTRQSCGASSLNQAITSINAGKPVIYYSTFGGAGMHFFVLTGYDSATKTFSANDPYSGGDCISTVLSHKLTYDALNTSSNCIHINLPN